MTYAERIASIRRSLEAIEALVPGDATPSQHFDVMLSGLDTNAAQAAQLLRITAEVMTGVEKNPGCL